MLLPVVVAGLIGCSSDAPQPDSEVVVDAQTVDGRVGKKDAPVPCAGFGDPVPVTQAVVGREIVTDGKPELSTTMVKAATDAACVAAKQNLQAMLLVPRSVTPAGEKVLLIDTKRADPIYCGCKAEESSFCASLTAGKDVRVKGVLARPPTCKSPPCYRLALAELCAP